MSDGNAVAAVSAAPHNWNLKSESETGEQIIAVVS
jgi:hypothetical protein